MHLFDNRVHSLRSYVIAFASVVVCLPIVFAAVAATSDDAEAALSYNVDPNGWPSTAHRDAAVAAIQSATNRYNAYGDFGNHNVYVYFNSGIPTAQANYLGSIGFGGTYPNERVTMHELAHYLGSGTYGDPWDGARGESSVDQFDGLEGTLQGDANHFWPYGLNYDSEGSEINKQRQVAMIYAQRADMGIGSTANPWSATVVNQTSSDTIGESGFNYAGTWSDNRFAHAGAAYFTGNFLLRTPASGNSFNFVGDSLSVNNTNGINGGLLYKGTGSTGVVRFKNLILDGGYVRHANSTGDLFQLAGKVTLASSSTIDAAQGNIAIAANIGGGGSLTKAGSYTLTLSSENTYGGSTTINAGTLRLAPAAAVATYSFDSVRGSTVVNSGTGGVAMNGALANGAAIVSGGRFGNAVSLANGASVDINSPIADLGNTSSWTVSAWVKTTTPGASIFTKSNGTGWSYGNTIFYLGDGVGQGSGGIPSAVRWAGGFFQGSTGATAVNDDTWHQVTYVNDGGDYAIYVDGVPQSLSAGNSSFSVSDVGTVVRLGITTNTVPADGTVNYSGLLDSVQFHTQALSAAQVAALYQGVSAAGPLPAATDVSIASSATLDVNGITQQIGSLSGPAGSAVTLGTGQLIVGSATNTQFAGTVSGTGGKLTKVGTGELTLSGSNNFTGLTSVDEGTLIINGSIAGDAVVKDGGILQGVGSMGAVVVETGGQFVPGLSPGTITVGGLNLMSGSTLQYELGPDRDHIVVTNNGSVALGGLLDLTILAGFNPALGQTFELFEGAIGSVTGVFSDVNAPIFNGHTLDLVYSANQVTLHVIDAILLPGDYSHNGTVDAADYTLWRDNFGSSTSLPNDDTAGVGQDDYDRWKANFGQSAGAGNSAFENVAVPEPATLLPLMLAVVSWCLRRRRAVEKISTTH